MSQMESAYRDTWKDHFIFRSTHYYITCKVDSCRTSTFPTVDHMSRNQSQSLVMCPDCTEVFHYTVEPLHSEYLGNIQKVSQLEDVLVRGVIGVIKCSPVNTVVSSFQEGWDGGVPLYDVKYDCNVIS